MHVTAIIAAAGEGRRLGAAVPKQLLDIGGRSILERSVMAFTSHDRVDDVIVVLPVGMIDEPHDWMERPGAHAVQVVAGGSRRQDSVANAFACVSPAIGCGAGARCGPSLRVVRTDLARD